MKTVDKIRFGLIGNHLKHSLSPIIHNAVFKKLEIEATYKLFELPKEDLSKFLSTCYSDNIRGLNVTTPYKEQVMSTLRRIDDGASLIGAVNTIKAEEGILIGYNTDGEGLIDSLNRIERKEKNKNFEFKEKQAVILGAGGAAKAIAFALASQDIKHLLIYDVDKPRTIDLVAKIKSKFSKLSCEALGDDKQLEIISHSHILVNATPVGMKADDPLIVNEEFLHKDLFVFDCVYNPHGRAATLLVETARRKGGRAFDGLWMLICQAIRSERIWLDNKIPTKEVFDIMVQALKEKGYTLC